MSTYAWVITKDHIDSGADAATGMSGPRDASVSALKALAEGKGYVFKLYDDDRELYYEGRLAFEGDDPEESVCYGPLGDFGMGWAGCTEVRYPGRPEWNCS